MNPRYLETARLMIQVAPIIFEQEAFALKGGTAINLFLRDMPRLSVDLDLVFTEHGVARQTALRRIADAIAAASNELKRRGFGVTVSGREPECKMFISRDRIIVKVEVNTVIRGSVHPARVVPLRPMARKALAADLELPVLDAADVYGSKLVAALDRQHPRDLFDVMQLFEVGGVTPAIRRAFVVYLAMHNRPPHEVLFGNFKNISLEFESEFVGMTTNEVTLAALVEARAHLAATLRESLDADERRFLQSIVNNEPDFEALGLPHLALLPGIQWKLQNLGKLQATNPQKFNAQAQALAKRLA